MFRSFARSRFLDDQRGASTVEFAILTPLIFMMLFGMLTGGLAWNRKQVLSHAARETARFAATYPAGNAEEWADLALARAREEAFSGRWPIGKYGYICVAYQDTDGNWSRKIQEGTDPDGDPPSPGALQTQPCELEDSRPADEAHVQAHIMEDVFLNAVLITGDIRIQSAALARHEVS